MDWSILLSTFGLVFVAELGDKTQLAVLTQTCKYRRPWAVFLGAGLALVGVTLLGAAGGQVVGQVVPPAALQWGAAIAFVVMGAFVAREAARTGGEEAADACDVEDEGGAPAPSASAWDWRAFGSTFGLLFVAEMGDKTQLAVLSLAGRCTEPLPVFAGGALALLAVTGLGVVGGEGLCRVIPRRTLLWASALLFVAMGVLIGLGVL